MFWLFKRCYSSPRAVADQEPDVFFFTTFLIGVAGFFTGFGFVLRCPPYFLRDALMFSLPCALTLGLVDTIIVGEKGLLECFFVHIRSSVVGVPTGS